MKFLSKLITSKDFFNIGGFVFRHFHKFFGLLSLILFFIQLSSLYTLQPGSVLSLLYILPNLLLAISGLIFHVPIKRIANKSTIHEEYRLHTIIFSLRAICIYILQWLEIKNWFVYFIAAVNPKETLASLALQRLPKFICNTSKANED